MRILVTGAGGFVGGLTAGVLADAGHEVLALHRRPPAVSASRPGLRTVTADLTGGDPLPAAIDALIHCAAEIPARCADEDRLFETNVEGTRRLFDHAAAAGARCIIFCSSMAVYGRIDAEVVTPDTPIRTPGAYGRSKLDGERRLTDLAAADPALRAVSIRLPGVVGAGSHDNFLSGLMPRILAGKPVEASNPNALFNNLVHGNDLARFVAALLPTAPTGHSILTIAADAPLSIRSVVSTLFQEAGVPEQVTFKNSGRPFLISPEPARRLGFPVPTVRDVLIRFTHDVRHTYCNRPIAAGA